VQPSGPLLTVALAPERVIELRVGAVVSNVYACPPRVAVESPFVATSVTPALFARSSSIEPLFAPVVPVVETETAHVADGAPPAGVPARILGAVPPRPLVVRCRFDAVTPPTGSLTVSVQPSGPAFTVALAPERLIELSVGGVVSNVYA